jgi:hypothetical protein
MLTYRRNSANPLNVKLLSEISAATAAGTIVAPGLPLPTQLGAGGGRTG